MFGIGAIVGLFAGGMNYLGELFGDQQWKAQEASRMANRITSEREWCESHNIDYWGSYCEKAWKKSQEYKVYQQWYVETWEPQYESEWRPKRELAETVGRILTVVSVLLVAPGTVVWLSLGAIGGIILTIKKLQGRSWGIWVFLLGLIPLALWLVYLAIMMLGGIWSLQAADSAKPGKRRCPQCRGWNDYQATRCQHCGQPIET